jgi:transcriptional regulator GlxA family with amidase domain
MRDVLIVLFDRVQCLDVTGPLEVFANGGYRVRTASLGGGMVRSTSGLRIVPDEDLRTTGPADLLLVPGGVGARESDRELVAWLRQHARRSPRLASVCTGAFLLAEAGLLDGRRVTTHWQHCGTLARRFPELDVDPEPIFIRDGDVFTSAGVTAGIDLALALVEEDRGRAEALRIARELVVFLRRPGNQAQFSAQLAAQVASREPLRDVQQWITENPAADLSVETLATRASLSPRQFARAFTAEVGMTPGRYVDRVRLESARRRLEDTSDGMEKTARTCGYGSTESMRRAFIRSLGTSPAEYKNRYGGNHADSNRAL